VTDAAVVLGYIDADHFLGGRMKLDRDAARDAIGSLTEALGMTLAEAAAAVLTIASETMIKAIEEITVNDGVNPRESVLVAGGGAAGLNILPIAQALGCRRVLLPKTAGALSACGAQYSDIVSEFSSSRYARTDRWPFEEVSEALENISSEMDAFEAELRGKGIDEFERKLFVDSRYLNQQWELELRMPSEGIRNEVELAELVDAFHETHERLYGVREPGASLECLNWKGRLTARLDRPSPDAMQAAKRAGVAPQRSAKAFFPEDGECETPVYLGDSLPEDALITGPAIIEEPTTTVVVYPGMRARVSSRGNYILEPVETAAATADGEIDPVMLAVMSNRIDAITREMTLIVLRSARSAVIGQSRDVSCAIVTGDNRLLATAEGLPAHIFGANLQTRSMCELHPDLRDGDAFLHNDPYMGNSHAADISVLVPVIVDGDHIFSISVKGHQADIGNALPTTYMPHAKDVYEEGALIFPAVQVQRDYKDIDDIIRMCQRRIRVPEQWHGDYLSQIGAARIGERRLKEFVAKYGKERVRSFVEEWFDYSERRAEHAIRKLPKGTLVQHGRHDPLGDFMPEGIELEVRITIDPDAGTIVNDLTNNPDCLDCGMNLTEATATVYGFQGMLNALDNDIPPNAGSFRRVRVKLRENCCVGIPRFPHSCSVATTNLGDLLVNTTQAAFTQLGDGHGLSQGNMCFGAAMGVISGRDWRSGDAVYINQIYLQGGGGPASPTTDGMVYLLIPVGAGLLYRDSVEVTEQRFPMILRALRILPDSCGAGRQRGGPGTEVIIGPRQNPLTISLLGGGKIHPPEGVLGGHGSSPSYNGLIRADGSEEELPYPTMVELEPGEFVRAIDSGGSGYGDPATRALEAVRKDVAERYVTAEHASAVYGVVLRESGESGLLEIDHAATEQRRATLRST
jgi:N-methylhydantoinase B